MKRSKMELMDQSYSLTTSYQCSKNKGDTICALGGVVMDVFKFDVINFHLTEKCNYRCTYCFAKFNNENELDF